jgi:hypothetical protein
VSPVEPDPEEGGDPPCWAEQFGGPAEDDADEDAEQPEDTEDGPP